MLVGNVVEQRLQAVLEVLDGASVTDVARRYEVTRQSVNTWFNATRLTGSRGSSISAFGRCRVRIRCHPRWKR